ncbi:MAG: hypothetical protein COA42_17050 [Alteromonadaceae bacterium]|nr:MAG: hypothetical protein COA42_17050 [Alteromonadaceae bacterium]
MSLNNTVLNDNVKVQFFECTSYEQLCANNAWLEGLIDCYRSVFKESWGEDYTYSEVNERLQSELAGNACLRFVLDISNNKVLAFCWAQFLDAEGVKQAIQSIHYVHTISEFSVEDAVPVHNGSIYIHDIGVLESYRGQVSLGLLLLPVLEVVSQRAGSRRLMFWSIKETCIAHLAEKINIQAYYEKGDVQFYSGLLPTDYGVEVS